MLSKAVVLCPLFWLAFVSFCPPVLAADSERTPARIEAIAQSITLKQRDALYELLCFGKMEKLTAIPGVGESKARAIMAARPFNRVTDVTLVKGIGESIFVAMVEHARAGFPKRKQP